ncbi:response regulator [Alteromonas sp. 5E99-2]|uniref:response regulator n=1 Tax=Alteromonas sp. 5E99-2 TaxID=2817683 RepID=UPI001A97EA90|nr:response regulator [Alteromonas sp. 5E99-2]MBO1254542.1 response regulator [Alteromonas sp. 5E99-2]
MNEAHTILIVEDEPKIAQILVDFLTLEGFQTKVLHDGKDVIDVVKQISPDFVVLDIMLPHKDGLTLCKEIRQFSDVPILMLTARVEEIDRLMGLGFGADDYVCKPFSAREVVARIQAILRRVSAPISKDDEDNLLVYRSIELNMEKHICKTAGNTLNLTPVEFRLLTALIKKPGVVFSRDQLMNACYDDGRVVSGRTIDSHMKNLRQKLSVTNPDDEILHAVYGVGYKVD